MTLTSGIEQVWTLTPSWVRPPLSMNDRHNRWREAELVKMIRTAAMIATRNAHIPPLEHATVVMTWTVPDRRKRDSENPVATLKPWCDGIVDAGTVVPNDTPEWMTKLMPVIEYRKGQAGVRFVVAGRVRGVGVV